MQRMIHVLFIIGVISAGLHAQDQTQYRERAFNLGIARYGVSFGQSFTHTGVRINWKDEHLRVINGLNLTLWSPGKNVRGAVNGAAVGLIAPAADDLNGVTAGVGAAIANRQMSGLQLGGVALVSKGRITGLSVAGIGLVGEDNLTGFHIGGGAVVSEKSVAGISIGGLACVSGLSMGGFTLGGLAVVSGRSLTGIQIGGLATVAKNQITGLTVGGLAVIGQRALCGLTIAGLTIASDSLVRGITLCALAVIGEHDITGINIGGAALLSRGAIRGLNVTLGQLEAGKAVTGVTIAGYRVKTPSLSGLNIIAGYNRTDRSAGITLGGWNQSDVAHTGLSAGLVNIASNLKGLQIGLINYVKSNPAPFKILPLINARF